MKQSLSDYIKQYKSDARNERLMSEARVGRILSEKMKSLREDSGITQAQLGERLGRPQSFISKLEHGGYDRCNVGTLTTVARAIGFELDFSAMFRPLAQPVYSHEIECEFDSDADKYEIVAARQMRARGGLRKSYAPQQLAILANDSRAPEESRVAA